MVHTIIGELGEIGAPNAGSVEWLVFLPIGPLQCGVAALYFSSGPAIALISACIGVGYVVATVFPSDRGRRFRARAAPGRIEPVRRLGRLGLAQFGWRLTILH